MDVVRRTVALRAWPFDLAVTVRQQRTQPETQRESLGDDGLRAAEPSDRLRLLPGFDPWIMGPGTADPSIIAPHRRALASRGANLVIRGGVVSGTWRILGPELAVSWFGELGPPPTAAIETEAADFAARHGGTRRLTIDAATPPR